MAAWEYRIEQVSVNDKWGSKRQAEEVGRFSQLLNSWGAEGWEMVGFETVPLTGSFSGNIKGYVYFVFLKRPA